MQPATPLPSNFLLINKPAGWTSFDVVAYTRNAIRRKKNITETATAKRPRNDALKVGHAGTLDPFATGLLIVGVGREATKRLDEFKNLPKTYVTTVRLGAVSDTYDGTGTIRDTIHDTDDNHQLYRTTCIVYRETPSEQQILDVLQTFKGKQLQTPPMFSAKKINGQRLYKLARQGKEVKRQPSEIEILDIKILGYSWPILKIEVSCSAGTYIRSLAHDIGQKLGTGAYCEELERTRIGSYKIQDAISIDKIS